MMDTFYGVIDDLEDIIASYTFNELRKARQEKWEPDICPCNGSGWVGYVPCPHCDYAYEGF